MHRQEAIRLAEKELLEARKNLENGKKNRVPMADLDALERKVQYREAVLEAVRGVDGEPLTLEQLRELVEADRDGRCWALPVKVGETVYTNIAIHGDRYRNSDRPYPVKVIFIGIGEGSVYFNVEYDNGRIFPVEIRDIGKTVFLTREAAETALKG